MVGTHSDNSIASRPQRLLEVLPIVICCYDDVDVETCLLQKNS